MERLQTIKQSKEGGWAREEEEEKEEEKDGIEGSERLARDKGKRGRGETRRGVREGQRTPKRIGNRDGKSWTVERRPLGFELSRSMAATVQEGREIPSVLAHGSSVYPKLS